MVQSILQKNCLCVFIVFSSMLYISNQVRWRQDRRPKIMGEKLIQTRNILPFRINIQRKIVMYHNSFRSRVVPRSSNMLRMKWHRGAAKAAQKWANNCMFLTHDNTTGRHIERYGSCGQNIFVSSEVVPWLFAIKTWYLEKDNFTYGSSKNDLHVVGHYTQMIWATTHQVGCGLSKCHRIGNITKKLYYNYVCNYCPIGNRQKQLGKPYKRGKPCRSCKKDCHKNKLCTNACLTADLWANCKELYAVWPTWLCQPDNMQLPKAKERFNSCKATCTCHGKLHD